MRSVDLCVLTANSMAPIDKHTKIYDHIYIEKGEIIRLVMIPMLFTWCREIIFYDIFMNGAIKHYLPIFPKFLFSFINKNFLLYLNFLFMCPTIVFVNRNTPLVILMSSFTHCLI